MDTTKYTTQAYWNDAYANGAYIPNANDFYTQWVENAAAFRVSAKSQLDISYGASTRNRFDLFLPEPTPKGLAVFIHGGYWLQTDKSMWSHLAAGCVERGWACALPSYDLCPTVRIADITQQIASAIKSAASIVEGPIRITGHSAGGHLAMRMACDDTPLGNITSRVEHILGISGLYDLRPLMQTSMNKDLNIDDQEALSESPVFSRPKPNIKHTSWVGSNERPEFLRQSALLSNIWAGFGPTPELVIQNNRHHFDVIAGLSDPNSAIINAFLA